MKNVFYLFVFVLFIQACSSDPKPIETETIPQKTEELVASINYDVIGKLPHDLSAYTEGLLFHNNQLFESTGAPENLPQIKTVVGILDTVKGKIDAKIEVKEAIRKHYNFG